MTERHRVAGTAELEPGTMMRVAVGTVAICLVRTEEDCWFAIQDRCTHEDESLSEGWLEGNEVECPRHSSVFDLRNGVPTSLPATQPATTYPVTTSPNEVFVEL